MKTLTIALLSLFLRQDLIASTACRAPTMGADAKASKATVVGTVFSTNSEKRSLKISVNSKRTAPSVFIVENIAEDRIFTQYAGGSASFADIKEGDEVQIWRTDCQAPKKDTMKAAVVVVLK